MKQRTKPRDCFRAQPNIDIAACDTPRCPRRHSCLRWKAYEYHKQYHTNQWISDFADCKEPDYLYQYDIEK